MAWEYDMDTAKNRRAAIARGERLRSNFIALGIVQRQSGCRIYTLKELNKPVVRHMWRRELIAVNPMEEEHVSDDGSTTRGYRVSITDLGDAFYEKMCLLETKGWRNISARAAQLAYSVAKKEVRRDVVTVQIGGVTLANKEGESYGRY